MIDKETRSGQEFLKEGQAEKALRESEERYRTMIGNLPGFVYRCENDRDWTMSFISDGCRDVTGYAPEDLLNNKKIAFNNVIRADYRERTWQHVQECLRQKKAFEHEYPIVVASGETDHWVWERGRGIFSDIGELLYIEGFISDITERKQAEEEIRREQAFFDQLVERAPEGIAIDDPHGRVLQVNAEFVRMFGYEADEAVGQDIDDLVAPPAREEEARAMTASTSRGETNFLETVRRRKDGTLIDVSIIATPIVIAGKLEAVYGIYRDITDRKRVEEALRASEMRYRTFIDASSDLVFLKDESFRYLISNGANNSFLGKSEENVIGRTDFELMPHESAEHCRASDQEALARGKNVTTEESVGARVYQTIKFPVPLPSGRVGLGCYIRDITERKQAEEARDQAEAQLRQSQKMEAIGTLAGGVAHDFNNLLTGILGNIALMRISLTPADPLRENLDAAETAARQAADLTKGLLTFGRSAMVLPVSMRIANALDATLAILRQSLPASMEIVRDDEQTVWNVLLDPSQMTQILLNLAVNARDAMEGKGTLTIRSRNEVVGEEYAHNHPFARMGEFVHLSVRDTGSGIPPAILEHLFEPFHTTKPVGSGTGLGLSVVYGAVKQAGGWITAVSTDGVGTTFDIYLPRCLQEPTESVAASPIVVKADSGTVLVVEDEPVVRAVAQGLLTRSGYTVVTAPDGASALNVLRDHPGAVGLVLLDMTMPGMTTDEIVDSVRTLDPMLPILLNSGYASNDTVRRMLDEGNVQGFLGKPYGLHELVENVQKLISRG
jgi:PAS domain S-box-containing protein